MNNQHINTDLKKSEVYVELIKKDKTYSLSMPDKYFTNEMCIFIAENYSLYYIPSKYRTEEIILRVCNKPMYENAFYNLSFIPKHLSTPELWLKIANIIGPSMAFIIPKELYSKKLSAELFKLSMFFMAHIPKKYITREMSLLFANNMESESIKHYIPQEHLDQEILDIINKRFTKPRDYYLEQIMLKTMSLAMVPLIYRDKEFCLQAVKEKSSNLSFVPRKILDKDIIAQTTFNTVMCHYTQKIIGDFNNFTNYWDCERNCIIYSIEPIETVLGELVGPNCFYKEDDCAYTIYENVQKVIPGYIYNSYENIETERYIIFKK